MTTEESNQVIVIDPNRKGIVLEDASKWKDSIFRKVYSRAEKLTQKIVDDNVNNRKDFQSENIVQLDNIITFVGRRGTGKTSAMLSYMQNLQNNHKKENAIKNNSINCKCKFISLDWIDASLLEKNEDIFDTILAKMFGEFLEISKNTYRRKSGLDIDDQKLYQQFQKIFMRVSNLKKDVLSIEDSNALNILRDLARSNEVREYFSKLVKMYIEYTESALEFENSYYGDTYLVIAIDDIDVNANKGYEILEQIHRYLMIPGLIVLLAINYEEMLLCCEKRYIEIYGNLNGISVEDLGMRAVQNSEEYLEKVLPPYMRLYLPSLKKTDYALEDRRKIRIGEREYSIKEGLFNLIREKTGVFYDAKGKKRHFMEPLTLRNLSTIFQLFNEMPPLQPEGSDKYLESYDNNYYKVMDDILFRFASDALPNKEYRMFMKWSEENILRRGEDIIWDVLPRFPKPSLENFGDKSESIIFGFEVDYKKSGYSYGELLRCMYCMSRSRKKIFDKKLVHVLLNQYTVVFSRIYTHYIKEELPDILKRIHRPLSDYENREKLRKLIGGSVGGSLAKFMLPGATGNAEKKEYLIGEWGQIRFANAMDDQFTCCIIGKESELYDLMETKWTRTTFWKKCKRFLRSEHMKAFLIWMFFFEKHGSFASLNSEYSFIIREPSEETVRTSSEGGKAKSPESKYRITCTGGEMSFNILGFVSNAFRYYDVIRNFYIAMLEALNKRIKPENRITDAEVMEYADKILAEDEKNGQSLLYLFREWEELGGLAIPVYNMDITYNLLKRCVVECNEERSKITTEETYKELCGLFKKIGQKLKDQDDFYASVNQNGKSNFEESFKTCPIMEVFLDTGADKECSRKYIKDILEEFLGATSAKDKFSNTSNDPE